jgi:hypothetical protein
LPIETFSAPAAPETELTRRVRLTQATVDKFDGAQLSWGKSDCLRMFASHVRQFGYRVNLAKYGTYSTIKGAISALRKTHKTMSAGVESYGLRPIGYASAWPGDIIAMPGADSDWEALGIYLGNGRALAFGDNDDQEVCGVGQPLEIVGAWRVEWLKR